MRVPELQQQFRYESPQVPTARLQGMQVQTNAAMFGADSGRQMEKAGYMLQRGAEQFSHLMDDYNTTKARDAASKMQQGFIEWQSEAQKKQGEAGMNTAADYDTWAKTKREELTKGMSDVQRGRFEGMTGTHMAAQRHWASGYGQQQEETYHRATWQAGKKTFGDTLVTNIQNPELAQEAIEGIKDIAFTEGQHSGLGEAGIKRHMYDSVQEALVPAIHARIQSGDTGTASILMQQYGTNIGGTAMAQLGAELKRERKRAEAEARANAAEGRRALRETAVNKAYSALYSMPSEEAQNAIMNPEWQKSMGLTADMAKDAGSLLHTMRGWKLQTQKQDREKYETDLYTNAVNLGIGKDGVPKDPIKAMHIIQSDPQIDGKTKMEMLNAVQNNLIDRHDDALFVNDMTKKIIETDGAISDSEILQGVATGKFKQSTAKNMMDLREMTQGGSGPTIKNAFSALNEMFRKSMMADGTPEHAAAHLSAQRQLQSDIDAARQSGNVKELERVTSPEYIITIGRRFSLSIQDQQKAVINKLNPVNNAPPFERGMRVPTQVDGSTRPSRKPGESIQEYRKRVGGK